MIKLRPALPSDAAYLAPRLRDMDRMECEAIFPLPVEDVLHESIRLSAVAVSITSRDDLLGVFGVVPESEQVGLIWLVGTNGLLRHQRELMRKAPALLQEMHKVRPCLTNIVHEKNTVHRRWLHHFGFKRLGVEQHGPHNFIQFARMH